MYPDGANIEAVAHRVWPATGPALAAGGATLLHNAGVGKCLLQFLDARDGSLRVSPSVPGYCFQSTHRKSSTSDRIRNERRSCSRSEPKVYGSRSMRPHPVGFIESCLAICQR